MRFKIGDKVRVRSWEDLRDEFGLNPKGHINTFPPLTVEMNYILNIEKASRTMEIEDKGQIYETGPTYYKMKDIAHYKWLDVWMEEDICKCRSYHDRTGKHVDGCPLFAGENDFILNRWELLDL